VGEGCCATEPRRYTLVGSGFCFRHSRVTSMATCEHLKDYSAILLVGLAITVPVAIIVYSVGSSWIILTAVPLLLAAVVIASLPARNIQKRAGRQEVQSTTAIVPPNLEVDAMANESEAHTPPTPPLTAEAPRQSVLKVSRWSPLLWSLVSVIIDAAFAAAWLVINGFSARLLSSLPNSGFDKMTVNALQVIFTITTGISVLVFIARDIVRLGKRITEALKASSDVAMERERRQTVLALMHALPPGGSITLEDDGPVQVTKPLSEPS
jgi:hypothetical protein